MIVGWRGALHDALRACRGYRSVLVPDSRCQLAGGVLYMMLLERAVQLELFLYQLAGAGGLGGCSA